MRQLRVSLRIVAAEMSATALLPHQRGGGDQLGGGEHIVEAQVWCRRSARGPQSMPSAATSDASSRMTPTLAVMARRSVRTACESGSCGRRCNRRCGDVQRESFARRHPVADVVRDAGAEHHRLEQRIGGQAVRSMGAGGGHFAAGPQAFDRGAAVRVGQHATHMVVGSRRNRDRLPSSDRAPPPGRRQTPSGSAPAIQRRACGNRGRRHGRSSLRDRRRGRQCRERPKFRVGMKRAHEALAAGH